MPDDEVIEGSQSLTPDGKGAVSLTKYIGVKEMLSKREEALTAAQTKTTELEAEVKNLGEQLKQAKESAVDPDKIKTLEGERDTAKTELAQIKRAALLKEHGVNPDDVKDLTEEQLAVYVKGLSKGKAKPGADMGGGGGGVTPGSAREKIKSGFDVLHPAGK